MAFETLGFIEGMHADASPLEMALLRSDAEDRKLEAAESRERAEREAARNDRTEGLAIANRVLGDPLGQLSRARSQAAAADDEIAELEKQLVRAKSRRESAESQVRYAAESLSAATATAQRSDPLQRSADAAREALAEAAGARVERMLAAPAGARPFAQRSAGDVSCKLCVKFGATAEQSAVIHRGEQAGQAARSADDKISELMAKGYSLETARLACTPAGDAELAEFGRQTGTPYRPQAVR